MIASHSETVFTVLRDRTAMAGWTLSALFAAFMLGASVLPKLAGLPVASETWPVSAGPMPRSSGSG